MRSRRVSTVCRISREREHRTVTGTEHGRVRDRNGGVYGRSCRVWCDVALDVEWRNRLSCLGGSGAVRDRVASGVSFRRLFVLIRQCGAPTRSSSAMVAAGLRGQSTVEAVCMIPVLFALLLLLIQPAILLYDRMVMQAAATETCRLLATAAPAGGIDEGRCEEYARHRLGSIPSVDVFHVHDGGCTWKVELQGNESSAAVSVRISTEVEPLPLVGMAAGLLGASNGRGNFEVQVEASQAAQPEWAQAAEGGLNPPGWIGVWLE